MLTRRRFTIALASAASRGAELPRVELVTLAAGSPVPSAIARTAVTFTRAYLASPDPALAPAVLLSGRYPHATGPALFQIASGGPTVFVSAAREDSSSEAACRVALAIRHPKLPAGRAFDFPVSTVDIAPTLLALMDVEPPEGLPGRDLSALLTTGQGPHPESIFAEGALGKPGEWRMVVRGLDKIVVRRNLDVLHLYNLGEDPYELEDLSLQIGYRLKVDELKAIVRIWMKRTSDGMDPSGLKRRK